MTYYYEHSMIFAAQNTYATVAVVHHLSQIVEIQIDFSSHLQCSFSRIAVV